MNLKIIPGALFYNKKTPYNIIRGFYQTSFRKLLGFGFISTFLTFLQLSFLLSSYILPKIVNQVQLIHISSFTHFLELLCR